MVIYLQGSVGGTYRDLNIYVEAEKEGDGMAFEPTSIPHAMNCRNKNVVGDSLQEIANIYHESAMYGLRWDVFPVFIENFEASEHILG